MVVSQLTAPIVIFFSVATNAIMTWRHDWIDDARYSIGSSPAGMPCSAVFIDNLLASAVPFTVNSIQWVGSCFKVYVTF